MRNIYEDVIPEIFRLVLHTGFFISTVCHQDTQRSVQTECMCNCRVGKYEEERVALTTGRWEESRER